MFTVTSRAAWTLTGLVSYGLGWLVVNLSSFLGPSPLWVVSLISWFWYNKLHSIPYRILRIHMS
jgi:hypothetical protein